MSAEQVLEEAKLRKAYAQSMVHAEKVYDSNKKALMQFGLRRDANAGLKLVKLMLNRLELWRGALKGLQRKVRTSAKRLSELP